jgi:tRNA A-37 threonylcarbamoyl transferase component Bud32
MSMSSDFALSILNNKYVLTRLLGNGGFGEVYEAYDPRLGTHYAVKIVHCETEEKRRQVTHEAKLLAQHSKKLRFIPDVYDVWPDGRQAHIVMEFIEGPTLQARLEQSPQPWTADRVELFLRILLRHLDQLHDAGIVHRDLKPSNIKDHPERGYILLDFGIAKQSETYTFAKDVGTVEYAPLEQLTQGGSTDQRSDLYSLGATAYQLLTRQLPTPPHLRHASRHNGQGETLIPPGRLVPGVPPALERTLLALLGLDPAERPANARAALALLDGTTTDTVISPPTPKRPTPPPAPPPAPLHGATTAVLPGALPTVQLNGAAAPALAPPGNGQLQVAMPLDPRRALIGRATAWWRELWQPTSPATLIFTALWSALGALTGWGAGWSVMLSAEGGRTLLFPFFGATVGAIVCCLARLLAKPKGHATEPTVAAAGLYVGGMALVGALVGGLQAVVDPALGGQDGTVMLGAAFGPFLGVAAALLLRTLRDRALDTLQRVGTGTVFAACSGALLGIAAGGTIGFLLWLLTPGSAGNLLSDSLVPGALGGGLVAGAIGLYLGSATLLLRDE